MKDILSAPCYLVLDFHFEIPRVVANGSCCSDSMRTCSFNNTRFPLNGSRQSGDCIDASCAFSRAKEQRTEYVTTKLPKVVSPSATSLFLKQWNAKVIRWVSLQNMVAFFNF